MNLYNLSESFNNLVEVLETQELTEDIKEIIEKELENINLSIQVKADNIIRFIKNLDAESKAIREEERKLAEKRKVIENKKANLEKYLFDFTSHTEGRTIKGGIFTVSIKKNPPKLNIVNLKAIPKQYIKVIEEVDKTELKNALKNGEIIDGAELIQEESLKIK